MVIWRLVSLGPSTWPWSMACFLLLSAQQPWFSWYTFRSFFPTPFAVWLAEAHIQRLLWIVFQRVKTLQNRASKFWVLPRNFKKSYTRSPYLFLYSSYFFPCPPNIAVNSLHLRNFMLLLWCCTLPLTYVHACMRVTVCDPLRWLQRKERKRKKVCCKRPLRSKLPPPILADGLGQGSSHESTTCTMYKESPEY